MRERSARAQRPQDARQWSMAKRLRVLVVLSVIAATFALMHQPPPAGAGGSWLYPVADRYEPGDQATLVGYTGGGAYGSPSDGPFYGYLYKSPEGGGRHPAAIPLHVGELEVTRWESRGTLAHRAAITFTLPTNLKPGLYWLDYCNLGCEEKLGDLIAGELFVGVNPDRVITRGWPANEPEIANLLDDGSVAENPLETEAQLSSMYVACVEAAGYDLGGVAQVLIGDSGLPYYVKTPTDVPAEFHSPCFEAIGGAPGPSSSWNQPISSP